MSGLVLHHQPTLPDRGLVAASAATFVGFVAILLIVILSGGHDTLDTVVAADTQGTRSSAFTTLAQCATALGSFPAVVTVAVAAAVGLWFRTRQLWSSAILASAVAATASLVTLVKIAVGRPRPDVTTLVGSPAVDFSFPSGHTTNGTLVYVLPVLLLTSQVRHVLWRRVAVTLSIALALLIGLSRIYLGYHWTLDVLAGWLLAAGVITASLFCSRLLALTDNERSTDASSAREVIDPQERV